jgi:hypothetical protein
MNIPLGLELKSFYSNDEEVIKNNEDFDIPIPEESIITKPIMFYTIDNVKQNGDDMCYVESGGMEYCIDESYESVNTKIRNQMIVKLN